MCFISPIVADTPVDSCNLTVEDLLPKMHISVVPDLLVRVNHVAPVQGRVLQFAYVSFSLCLVFDEATEIDARLMAHRIAVVEFICTTTQMTLFPFAFASTEFAPAFASDSLLFQFI